MSTHDELIWTGDIVDVAGLLANHYAGLHDHLPDDDVDRAACPRCQKLPRR